MLLHRLQQNFRGCALRAAQRAAAAPSSRLSSSASDAAPPSPMARACAGVVLRGGASPRVLSADAAMVELALAPGATVFAHTAAATPTPLLEALTCYAEARPAVAGAPISVVHLHLEGVLPHLRAPGRLRDRSYFCGVNVRAAIAAGDAEYVPIALSALPGLFRSGAQPLDAALVTVSPPDAHGWCSLGTNVDASAAALAVARRKVALVTPGMPRTFGDAAIHVRDFDLLVPGDEWRLHEAGAAPKTHTGAAAAAHRAPRAPAAAAARADVDERIAQHVAALVRDGDTLQLGIGAIPDRVLRQLTAHRDLGVHSEMISDGIIDLCDAGVITNARKPLHRGLIAASFAFGSARLYHWLHDNAGVVMRDAAYINDVSVIRSLPNMVGINSAIEIDLSGQVVSDSIGPRIFSGVGGQGDFIQGVSQSTGGRAIIAMPSRTTNGESRIVATLRAGGGVVTTRAMVQYVCTEYGAVNLYGLCLKGRAAALTSIAHPDDREALERAGHAAGVV